MTVAVDAPPDVRLDERRGLAGVLAWLLGSASFAYATIVLLQLKRLWGLWDFRELTGGDTCSYFVSAYTWYSRWHINFAWSPLYTSFYGMFLYVTRDAAVVTYLHRVTIALLAAVLVLAVARRMLPDPLAWLVAAWWAVLPINFDTMYEVHLFAVLPILIAWLVAMSGRGPWSRGIALAILVADTFLVRNEIIVAVGLLAIVFATFERQHLKAAADRGAAVARVVAAYLIPLLLAVALIGFYFHQSDFKGKKLRHELRDKHTVNMGQVFAFGYQQRHPTRWKLNPWSDYGRLMKEYFGKEEVSLGEMIRRNPSRVVTHFLWNFRLAPNGIQLLLFNAISGELDPDYAPVTTHRIYVGVLSGVAGAIVVFGLVLLRRQWDEWRRTWFAPRAAGWAAMLCVSAVALVVIPTQRPRPSYLFPLGIMLMVGIATCGFVIVSRLWALRRAVLLMPLVMVLLPIIVPNHWPASTSKPRGPDTLYAIYERLHPYQHFIDRRDAVFLGGGHSPELAFYLGYAHGRANFGYEVFHELTHETTLAEFLDRKAVNLFYIDTHLWRWLDADYPGLVRELATTGNQTGWRLVGFGEEKQPIEKDDAPVEDFRWALFHKTPSRGAADAPYRLPELFPGTEVFAGWYPVSGFEYPEGPYPQSGFPHVRWGLGPSSKLVIRNQAGGRFKLVFSGMAPVAPQKMEVKLDGKSLGTYSLTSGFAKQTVPLGELPKGKHEIELDYATFQDAGPDLKQAVLFNRLLVLPEEHQAGN